MTTIFLNGDILTMTESEAQAVVVTDGRIVLAGPEALARAYFQAPDTHTVDLTGATLMPDVVGIPKSLDTQYAGQNMYESAIRNTCGLMILTPLIIIYLFAQRYLIQGIERSGITG